MAIGDVTTTENAKRNVLLLSATGDVTDITPVRMYQKRGREFADGDNGYICYPGQPAFHNRVCVSATADDEPTGTVTLMGYLDATDTWYPVKEITIAAAGADTFAWSDVFTSLSHFDALGCLADIGGANPTVTVVVVTAMEQF